MLARDDEGFWWRARVSRPQAAHAFFHESDEDSFSYCVSYLVVSLLSTDTGAGEATTTSPMEHQEQQQQQQPDTRPDAKSRPQERRRGEEAGGRGYEGGKCECLMNK